MVYILTNQVRLSQAYFQWYIEILLKYSYIPFNPFLWYCYTYYLLILQTQQCIITIIALLFVVISLAQ